MVDCVGFYTYVAEEEKTLMIFDMIRAWLP